MCVVRLLGLQPFLACYREEEGAAPAPDPLPIRLVIQALPLLYHSVLAFLFLNHNSAIVDMSESLKKRTNLMQGKPHRKCPAERRILCLAIQR